MEEVGKLPEQSAPLPPGLHRVRLLLGGWAAAVLAFLYLPIALLVVYSFNRSKLNIVWEGFTVDWYSRIGLGWYGSLAAHLWAVGLHWVHLRGGVEDLAAAPPLVEALNNSVIIAAAVTALSVVLGTLGAWLLHRYRFFGRGVILGLVMVPVVIPEVIMGISLLIFFVVVNTAGNAWLGRAGIDTEPLGLGYCTVIIAHTTFCFPFVMIAVQARLAGMDPSLEEAALDLGATPARAFWSVVMPYLMPAIVSGALMAFTLSLDEVIVTYFTTGPDSVTLPVKVFGLAKVGLNPTLNAVSTLFIVATVGLVLVSEYVRKLGARGGKR